ncbi:MAG TPA: potassium-transporting ATPase subunit F [Gemmatimonadales bacterium]|nr:potassium-transporting ATPase subunit F [Gemmatimonadales bacterium]
MSADTSIGALCAAGILVYLVYTLVHPERF